VRRSRCSTVVALAAVLGVAVALSGSVQAEPVVYEPFDYVTPGNLVPQTGGVGFSGPWATFGGGRNPVILPGDLTWGSLPTTGNYAQANGINAPYRPLGSALADNGLLNDGATLWFSYVADMSSQPNMTNLDLNIGLTTETFSSRYPTQTDYNNKVHLINNGQGIGVSMDRGVVRGAYWQDDGDGDSYGERHLSSGSLTLGTDEKALIVGKIDWGSTEETLTLYTPDTNLQLGTPILSTTAPNLNQALFNTLAIGWKDTPSIDEIRFGATAGDVLGTEDVPVPVVIPVHNGSFELIYKPGSTTINADLGGGWTQGVGPATPMDNGTASFSDGTSGDTVDIPGWIGADVQGWIDNGGTYGRDTTTGNRQGSVARQSAAADGLYYYLSNGGGWGNPAGGLIVSDAPVATVEANATYILSMLANGSATPIVLDLLAGGVEVTPTSSVDPTLSGEWQEFSRTYDPASLASFVGQDLTILLGVDRGAVGAQSHFDSVGLTVIRADLIPEPATLSLLGLGALLALRRRRSR